MPLMPGTQDVAADAKGGPLPVTKVSAVGAEFIHWSGGGRRLHWSTGPNFYTVDSAALFGRRLPAENAPKFQPPTSRRLAVDGGRRRPARRHRRSDRRPDRHHGGRGRRDHRRRRASSFGATASSRSAARGEVAIPAGAKIVDVAGKTIIPGLVDAHAHGPQGEDDLIPQQNWAQIANLALGTTTVHDPSARAAEIFAAAEMQRAGKILAPRTFSTGEIVYGAKAADIYAEINTLRGCARPRPPAQGAGRAQRQELQPAAPRPAADGRGGVPARGNAGRARRRLALHDGHHAHPGRQLHARAQSPGRDLLRGRGQPLDPDEDQLHADPGRDLWRPRRRSLLAPAYGRLEAPLALQARAAAPARRPERPADHGAGGGFRRRRHAPAKPRSSPTAASRSRSAPTASRPASARTGSCGRSSAAA